MSERPPDRSPGFRITAEARHAWEAHGVPHTIEDVVEAIFRLPSSARGSILVWALGDQVHVIPWIDVLGHRFMVFGERDAAGRWSAFRKIEPQDFR